MGVRTVRGRDTGVKGGMMCRSGGVCGLPAGTNEILSENPYCFLNIIQILFAPVR